MFQLEMEKKAVVKGFMNPPHKCPDRRETKLEIEEK